MEIRINFAGKQGNLRQETRSVSNSLRAPSLGEAQKPKVEGLRPSDPALASLVPSLNYVSLECNIIIFISL